MICLSLQKLNYKALLKAISRAEMAEIRLDLMELTVSEISKLFSKEVSLIATCRLEKQPKEVCFDKLTAAIKGNGPVKKSKIVKYVDIEYDAPAEYREAIVALARENGFGVILSYHNFSNTDPFERLLEITGRCFEYGADIAKKLRRSNFLTDIIFYSSAPPHNLRRFMFDHHVDGVFCINRSNLQGESFDIIQNRIRKILDINHMRGIVMEVVSEFDESISDLTKNLESKIDDIEKRKGIYSFIQEKITTISSKNDSQISNIINHESGCNFEDLMNHRACSSFIKYEILKKMLEDLEDKYNITNILEVLKKYSEEVIVPRNELAHVKPTEEKGKTVFKVGDKLYGENEFKLLRQNLLNHRDNFNDLKNLLINGNLEEVQRE